MATDKPLKLDANGNLLEFTGVVVSAGAADTGRIPALDATGRLDPTTMPVGIVANTKAILVNDGAGLAAGDFVNVFNNAGTINCRKADASVASSARIAHGYVKSAFANAATATVYFDDENASLAGMTPGARQYLSVTTPGGVQAAIPTTAGHTAQSLGTAITATTMDVEITDSPVVRV